MTTLAQQTTSITDSAASSFFPAIKSGERTFEEQGWMQLCALGVTLGISLLGGAFSGFIASRAGSPEFFFDDEQHWAECRFDVELEPKEDEAEAEKEHSDDGDQLNDKVN